MWSHLSPWGFFAFLCSIEYGTLPKVLWAIPPMFSPAAFAHPKHYWCPCLSLPLQVCSRSELLYSLALVFARVLVCTRQSGLLQHQDLALFSSPCMQYKCRPGMRALLMHHWPRSTAKQFFSAKKIRLSLICIILLETAQAVAHLLFCMWPIPILILQVSGIRDCLVHIPASSFCGLAFSILQGMFWFLNKTEEYISLSMATELHCVNACEHWLLKQFRKIKWNQILFPPLNMFLKMFLEWKNPGISGKYQSHSQSAPGYCSCSCL